jgi:hypothetical protein
MRVGAIPVIAFALAGAAQGQERVPIRLVRGRLPVVSVRVDARGPYDFLLDTGSTATVVRSDLARTLQAEIGRIAAVGTTLGPRGLPRAEIRSIVLGGTARGPLSVLVSELAEFRRLDSGIHGILGLDFLSSFDFLIDYEKRTVQVNQGMRAENGKGVAFRRESGRILVPVEPGSSDRVLWLVLDTGADSLILSGASGLAVERDPRRIARIDSAGGSAILRTGALRLLRAGSVVLDRVPVSILRENGAGLGSAGGLLPGRLFRRLLVSPSGGYVVFEPDPDP